MECSQNKPTLKFLSPCPPPIISESLVMPLMGGGEIFSTLIVTHTDQTVEHCKLGKTYMPTIVPLVTK